VTQVCGAHRTRLLSLAAALVAVAGWLIFLTDFAVDTRYPGRNASKRQASAALRWAEKVRKAGRRQLGVRESRSRWRKSR
jgi:hypothetical protein